MTRGLQRYAWLIVAGVLFLAAAIWLVMRLSTGSGDAVWRRIQSTRVVRVGVDATYPPYEDTALDGSLQGYDIDLANAIVRQWGADLSVQFVMIHFDGLYGALQSDTCDLVISAVPYDETMTEDVRYSQPYLHTGQVLLTAQGSPINSWRGLDEHSVAVELGSEAHMALRQLARDTGQQVTIIYEREPAQALEVLLSGRVEALVADSTSAAAWQRAHPELIAVDELLNPVALAVVTRHEASETMAEVNRALEDLRNAGTLQALHDKWF
ncbi:MAG: amino acid ABC transporter substrate-binding protein [Chloroflexi bacterium]|nr:amino acid ABC transporter substrate-binding protein [Chloroflexota bacterium]